MSQYLISEEELIKFLEPHFSIEDIFPEVIVANFLKPKKPVKVIAEGEVDCCGEFKVMDFKSFKNKYIKVYVEIAKEKSPKIFKWKDRELPTYGDIYNAIDEIETKKEGKEFIKAADNFCKGNITEWINSLLNYMCPEERINDIRILLGIGEDEAN